MKLLPLQKRTEGSKSVVAGLASGHQSDGDATSKPFIAKLYTPLYAKGDYLQQVVRYQSPA